MTSTGSIDPSSARLDGQVAVVTGAGNGIGRHSALALARFGAHVAICDKDEAALESAGGELEKVGVGVLTAAVDVRDEIAVERFAASVADTFGTVDVLVNNAAGTFFCEFMEMRRRGIDALVRENFLTVVNVTQAIVPHMTRGGSIVNMTSIEGYRGAPGFAVYAAMKAGVASLSSSLACELGARGIRVNSVAPDVIPTAANNFGFQEPVWPLGRVASPDDVAGVVVFLAGRLSSFVTGTTIHVDGGTFAAGSWHRDSEGQWRHLTSAEPPVWAARP